MTVSKKLNIFSNIDIILLVSTIILLVIGLIILYSSSLRPSGTPEQLDTSRQLLYVILGLVLMAIFTRSDYRVLQDYSKALYVFMIILLLAVAVFGATRLGATRWITIGFFQLQPSEFAKLFFTIFLASFFAKNYLVSDRLRILVYSVLFTALPVILVLAQPDLGTGLVFGVIWVAIVLASRVKKIYLLVLALLLLVAMPLFYSLLANYQKQRINTFINPTADPAGTGYNINQSLIAIGSGGLWGQGLSSGSQSQGNFLPSQNTDFIFAVLAEKLGFVGAFLSLGLYLIIVVRALVIARASPDWFGSFLAIGIAAMFLFHVLVNIGMNLGLLPVTGIPLPLLSAGGSSMMVTLVSIGILQSIYMRRSNKTMYLDSDRVVYSRT